MEDAVRVLNVPTIVRDEAGDVEHNLAVGEGGTWDLAHAITEGKPAEIRIAAQTDLMAVAEALQILVRAFELAAALGRFKSADELALAAAADLHEHSGEPCEDCPKPKVNGSSWF